jgi:ribonuclease P protein component
MTSDGPFDKVQGPSRAASRDGKLTKKEHVLKTADFRLIYKKGRSVKKDFVILYCHANDTGHNRIGFSISSRNIKNASARNRMRRHFREIYRKNRACLKPGFDLVFIIRQAFAKTVSQKVFEDLFFTLIARAGVMEAK